jgi:acetyl-CoA acetyltransferase
VNPSGGLKAKGHPIGATGVSMHVMAAMQLMGEAEGMQIPGAKSPASSTWAAPRSPITSRSWSA